MNCDMVTAQSCLWYNYSDMAGERRARASRGRNAHHSRGSVLRPRPGSFRPRKKSLLQKKSGGYIFVPTEEECKRVFLEKERGGSPKYSKCKWWFQNNYKRSKNSGNVKGPHGLFDWTGRSKRLKKGSEHWGNKETTDEEIMAAIERHEKYTPAEKAILREKPEKRRLMAAIGYPQVPNDVSNHLRYVLGDMMYKNDKLARSATKDAAYIRELYRRADNEHKKLTELKRLRRDESARTGR